jgi:hypothetical protein
VVLGISWLALLIWLMGQMPFLPAYGLALVPLLGLLAGAFGLIWLRGRLTRRRLLREEFSDRL